jgi:clathrin heavy chain
VAPEFISFKHTTMESDKYVCVRETGAQNTVVIVDLANPTAPAARRPITADSALMCPDKKVIALRAASPAGTPGDALQVFNLDTKTKLKAFSIAESVEFWKWVSADRLGIVTPSAVYHWDVSSGPVDAAPVKVFDRTANLQGAQIISYRVSADAKWCVLVGITPGTAERPALARGAMQLFSVEQQKSQPLEAHAAAFASVRFSGRPAESPASTVIAFAQKTAREGGAVASKLHVIELGAAPGGGAPLKRQAELFFPAEFADDFPVSLQVSERYGLVYVVTKLGLLFVYDLETATAVYRNRISPDPIFLAAASDTTGGVLAVNRRGQVLLATVNEPAVVPFVAQQLGNLDLAMALAKRGNGLPGAEGLAGQQFEKLAAEGKWKEAAEAAAESPQGSLRTPATLERLRAATAAPGQKPPILVYLGLLLARGKLNAAESAELARLTMRQGRKELLLGWWRDGKLEAGEELGDLLAQAGDKAAALKCYQQAGASGKVIVALAEAGDAAALQAYTGQQGGGAAGGRLDYMALLQQLMMTNPQGAVSLAKMALKQQPPAADANAVADLFLQRNMVREATAFLLDYLSPADRPEDAALQTKLLEVNLVTNPQVADAVLANGSLSHYDRPRVAQLCEKAGLYLRALQHYTDLKDIRRCVVNTHAIDPQALTEWFGSLSAEWALECLRELLAANPQGNLQLAVSIAREYSEQLEPKRIIALLESQQSYPGLYLYLGSRIATTEDSEEHYKYIEAAARTGQSKEVERVTRESAFYPPEKTKQFLMEAKLADARPLINVCDRHGLVPDLTAYLYSNGLLRYIEGYVQKVAPAKCPLVVGALLDAEAPDDFITALVLSVSDESGCVGGLC